MATVIASISSTPALSAEGGGRDICLDSSGRLWVVYSKIPAGLIRQQIYVAYSDDNGATWTEERVTTGYDGYHHFFPAIAADGFNGIHIVYQSLSQTDLYSAMGGDQECRDVNRIPAFISTRAPEWSMENGIWRRPCASSARITASCRCSGQQMSRNPPPPAPQIFPPQAPCFRACS